MLNRIGRRLTDLLASQWFFYSIIAFFILQAVWIALSAAYPMAFDEDFHLGIIRLFADGLSPFAAPQPESADSFGAIIRDPSYLYHFLMSVPYRFIDLFTNNQTAIVIFLRLINVALFTVGLLLFRKVLLRAKMSPAFTHAALAIFVLVPIVPQLAAHINYDNLLVPLLGWMCLLVARIIEGLRTKHLDAGAVGLLVLACMASSLIKYEFLPFVAAIVLFVGFMIVRAFGRRTPRVIGRDWLRLPRKTTIGMVVVFVVLLGLMAQRYGVNLAQYQTLKPSCDIVLDEQRCQAYGPWARNHWLEQHKAKFNKSPLAYSWVWLQSLHYRSFFAVSGPQNSYTNYPPLPLPAATAVIIAVSGLTALLLFWRHVFAGHTLLLFLCVMGALYLSALWVEDYSQFLETGQPVAINGRYLIPILLPLGAVFGRALSLALQLKSAVKPFLATAAIVLFLAGGGVITFILRSDSSWYWPNHTVNVVNDNARRMLAPIIFEGNKYY